MYEATCYKVWCNVIMHDSKLHWFQRSSLAFGCHCFGWRMTFQTFLLLFLTEVEPFHSDHISKNMLKRLLKKNIVRNISVDEDKKKDFTLFRAGSPSSYFTLILEGCVHVTIGKDNLDFESRSFSHFGAQALLNALESSEDPKPYIPDFTVRPATDCQVVIITRRQYLAAHKATIFEQENQDAAAPRTPNKPDVFTKEWEMAEFGDRENYSMSGLSPITKFLHKKPPQSWKLSKRKRSDQNELLASSPESSESDRVVSIQMDVFEDGSVLSRGNNVTDKWTDVDSLNPKSTEV